MTRAFRHAGLDRCAKGPADYSAALPYREGPEGYCDTPKEARETAPYKPGDVFYIREGGRIHLAKCYCIISQYQNRMGEWIPRYRVQLATRKGQWSQLWRDTWPGFIQRAYQGPDCKQSFTLAELESQAKAKPEKEKGHA